MSLSPNLIRIGAPLRSSLIVDYIDRIVIGTKVALNISSKQSINVDFVGIESIRSLNKIAFNKDNTVDMIVIPKHKLFLKDFERRSRYNSNAPDSLIAAELGKIVICLPEIHRISLLYSSSLKSRLPLHVVTGMLQLIANQEPIDVLQEIRSECLYKLQQVNSGFLDKF